VSQAGGGGSLLELFSEMYRRCGHGLLEHALATARVTRAVASELGYENYNLVIAAFLHDIGKIRWPDELFSKTKLIVRDWYYIEAHPLWGVSIIHSVWSDVPDDVVEIVAQHHERPCGKGYPRHIFSPLWEAQVVAAVDTYCAMQEARAYRSTIATSLEALEAIRPWAPVEVVRTLEKLQCNCCLRRD
jgi:putative nucleotidyltransferase with HDIG domain